MGFGSNYSGNADAVQTPSAAPAPGVAPTVYLPSDLDGASFAQIAQQEKVHADFLAHVQGAVRLDRPFTPASSSGFTTVNHSGAGTGTVTPSGIVKNAAGVRFMVKIIAPGAVATATFQVSVDGGTTYGATQTTAASMTDATSGITLAFVGTFTANDTYAFRSAFTPLALWTDAGGYGRFLVEHNGYPIGAAVQRIEEAWERSVLYYVNTSTLALASTINATTKVRLWDAWDVGPGSSGAGNVNLVVTNGGMGSIGDGYATISGNSSIAGDAFGITRGNIVYKADSIIVADFTLVVNTNNAAYNFKVGFTTSASQSASGSAQAEHACAVQVLGADMTKLYLYTNNGGGAGSALASSPAATVPFTFAGAIRCRLQLHGANTPFGIAAGGAVALLSCNEGLVAVTQATLPAAGQTLNFGIALKNLTASTANGINVGPIKAFWNSSLAGARM